MSEFNKAAAIFNSPMQLRDALQALSQEGFKDVSVLIKHEDHDDVSTDEARAYSTATYAGAAAMQERPVVEYPVTQNRPVTQDQVETQIERNDNVSEKDPNALKKASVTGGVLGALAGLAALAIPGVGPVLATGAIASAIGAMAAGGAVGMTAGAIGGLLNDEGLPSDRVDIYREAFEAGKGVVIVDSNEDVDILRARDVLNRFNPEYIDTF